MGWGILGDAWDSVKSGAEWIGDKATDVYNVGSKFVKEHADTIADVSGFVGDAAAFLATPVAFIPGVGTVAAAGLAGLGVAGKGIEAAAKAAKSGVKAVEGAGATIDAMRQGDTMAAIRAGKETIAAGTATVGHAGKIRPKKPKEEDKDENGNGKKKEIEKKKK